MSMSMMSLRGYFYRTWYPGMNSASGVIDPNKAYDCSRRLARLKKWSCWILVISFLIFMLTVIIYNLIPASGVAALNGTRCNLNNSESRNQQHSLPLEWNSSEVYGELEDRAKASNNVTYSISACPAGCPCHQCNGSYSDECFLPEMVCDGIRDCKLGEDETHCIALSSSTVQVHVNISSSGLEGYVLVRRKGVWHPYCSTDWSEDVGTKICQHVGVPNYNTMEIYNLFDYKRIKQKEEASWDKDQEIDRGEENKVVVIVANDLDQSEEKLLEQDTNLSDEEEHEWKICKIGYLKCSF